MKIKGRQITCYFLKDAGYYYLEVQQKEGDCPEGKSLVDCLLCPGDCQGTYLTAIIKSDEVLILGTIYPEPHIMYNQDFFHKHGFTSIESAKNHINKYIERGECEIKSFMKGRKKRIYIEGAHAQTLFEKCTFRHVQSEPFRRLINELRKETLNSIIYHLQSLKRTAKTTDLKSLDKELFLE